jgi:hypothetical protein
VFELLVKVVPLAVASTMSPVVFGIAVALLAGKVHQIKRTLAFFLGAIITVIILAIIGSFLGGGGADAGIKAIHPSASMDLVLGGLFIVFGIMSALPSKEKGPMVNKEGERPGLVKWFVVGFLTNILNFDAVLLNITAVKEVFQSGIAFGQEIAVTVFSDLFFLLPILVPLSVYLIYPKKAKKVLEPLGILMKKYGNYLAMAIFFVFGAYLIIRGLG